MKAYGLLWCDMQFGR